MKSQTQRDSRYRRVIAARTYHVRTCTPTRVYAAFDKFHGTTVFHSLAADKSYFNYQIHFLKKKEELN